MTTIRHERLTRQALGTPRYVGLDADTKASLATPALVISAVVTVLLLSGCALVPVQEQSASRMALDLGDATVWLVQVPPATLAALAGR